MDRTDHGEGLKDKKEPIEGTDWGSDFKASAQLSVTPDGPIQQYRGEAILGGYQSEIIFRKKEQHLGRRD